MKNLRFLMPSPIFYIIPQKNEKVWKDADNQDGKRPESVQVQLYADNTASGDPVKLNAGNDWHYTWSGLEAEKDGKDIVYTVKEVGENNGRIEFNGVDYVVIYGGSEEEGYIITNSYTPGKTSVSVRKAWDDGNNQDGIRPKEIVVKLLADKEDTGKTVKLNSGNNWSGSFTELDEYKDSVKISYTIEEVSVEGYKTEITGDMEKGFVITNHHTPASQEIPKGTDETENPPQTGDYSTSGFWATSWIISFISIVGIYLFKRKKKMK